MLQIEIKFTSNELVEVAWDLNPLNMWSWVRSQI